MKNIYVVTVGDYSDYRICGVFSTKLKAKRYIDSFAEIRYGNFNDIEEYVLDAYDKELKLGRKPYSIKMYKNGDVENISQATPDSEFEEQIYFNKNDNSMLVSCFAKNEKHATKIANEKRGQIIALDRWGINID